jgi:membrane associated rhomboid family serine protease
MLGSRSPLDESSEPALSAPRVVRWLIAVFVIVHVATLFLDAQQHEDLIANFALIPEQMTTLGQGTAGETGQRGLQFVTYAFLHADFSHLIFNSVWFLIFATPVARRIGTARFLMLSLVTALGAAATHLYFHWGSPVAVVGASGAISGLMAAAFRFIFVNPHAQLSWPPMRLPLHSFPVVVMSAAWVVLNVLLGVIGFTPQGLGESVAWEGHLGGYFTGLLAFPLFDRRRSWLR